MFVFILLMVQWILGYRWPCTILCCSPCFWSFVGCMRRRSDVSGHQMRLTWTAAPELTNSLPCRLVSLYQPTPATKKKHTQWFPPPYFTYYHSAMRRCVSSTSSSLAIMKLLTVSLTPGPANLWRRLISVLCIWGFFSFGPDSHIVIVGEGRDIDKPEKQDFCHNWSEDYWK